jgi:hypothetical protein
MPNLRLDLDPNAWQAIEDATLSYPMAYHFQMLGWDREAHTIDFVLRFNANGGHCQRHRHLSSTAVLIIEGEQHLTELHPDGSTTAMKRIKGEYARSSGADTNPHMERGGPEGGVVFYSCQAADGRLFEFTDDEGNVISEVTFEQMVGAWENHLARREVAG